MKRFLILLAVIAAFAMVPACDRYETSGPDKAVLAEFDEMYPEALSVRWEFDGYYWKSSFMTAEDAGKVKHVAWFEKDGFWIRTETGMLVSAVPQTIMTFLEESVYGDAEFDGNRAVYVETPEGNYYRFELLYGGLEIAVKVEEDGTVGIAGIDR